jgi:hypothetical protein
MRILRSYSVSGDLREKVNQNRTGGDSMFAALLHLIDFENAFAHTVFFFPQVGPLVGPFHSSTQGRSFPSTKKAALSEIAAALPPAIAGTLLSVAFKSLSDTYLYCCLPLNS